MPDGRGAGHHARYVPPTGAACLWGVSAGRGLDPVFHIFGVGHIQITQASTGLADASESPDRSNGQGFRFVSQKQGNGGFLMKRRAWASGVIFLADWSHFPR